jgi:hypothetical protein
LATAIVWKGMERKKTSALCGWFVDKNQMEKMASQWRSSRVVPHGHGHTRTNPEGESRKVTQSSKAEYFVLFSRSGLHPHTTHPLTPHLT